MWLFLLMQSGVLAKFGDRQGTERPISAPTLRQISNSDKFTHHRYDRYYDALLSPIRDKDTRLLEIGVDSGKSMSTWLRYFPRGIIYGIGYGNFQKQKKSTPQKRLTLYQGDQSNAKFLAYVKSDTGGNWDVIIDDGSHLPSHQRITFDELWSSIRPGGYYVIEDIETSYWKSGASIYGYELKHQPHIVEYFLSLVHNTVNREFSRSELRNNDYFDVESIGFGQNIIWVRKSLTADVPVLARPYRFGLQLRAPHVCC